ncbi:cullin-3 [Folsomia candida]|nr:cullin-3 [Folsomia candida]
MSQNKVPKGYEFLTSLMRNGTFYDYDGLVAYVTGAIKNLLRTSNLTSDFDQLHRLACIIVVRRYGEQLYNGINKVITDHLQASVRQTIRRRIDKDDFLETILLAWTAHKVAVNTIVEMCMNMDNIYVKPNKLVGLRTMGFALFKREIILCRKKIRPHISKCLSESIFPPEDGKRTCGPSLHVVKGLLNLIDELEEVDPSSDEKVYENVFEKHLLLRCAELYQVAVKSFTDDKASSMSYAEWAETRISQDLNHVTQYLRREGREGTLAKLENVMVEKLVERRIMDIFEPANLEKFHFLKNNRVEELGWMLALVGRYSGGESYMKDWISAYLSKGDDPSKYAHGAYIYGPSGVQNLLSMKDRLDKFALDLFSRGQLMGDNVIPDDVQVVIIQNKLYPELLPKYMRDRVERSEGLELSQEEWASFLFRTKNLFELVQKVLDDQFLEHLKKGATHHQASKYRKHEIAVKIQRMFKDVVDRDRLMDDFRHYCAEQANFPKMDLTFCVLTAEVWPIPCPVDTSVFPTYLMDEFQKFERFYIGKHGGRKLTLIPFLGTAELEIKLFPGGLEQGVSSSMISTRKTIQVGTMAMCVLLLFNENDELTWQEIRDLIKISETTLFNLFSGENNILVKSPSMEKISITDTFRINEWYGSKHDRLKTD